MTKTFIQSWLSIKFFTCHLATFTLIVIGSHDFIYWLTGKHYLKYRNLTIFLWLILPELCFYYFQQLVPALQRWLTLNLSLYCHPSTANVSLHWRPYHLYSETDHVILSFSSCAFFSSFFASFERTYISSFLSSVPQAALNSYDSLSLTYETNPELYVATVFSILSNHRNPTFLCKYN